jgi:comEA protein
MEADMQPILNERDRQTLLFLTLLGSLLLSAYILHVGGLSGELVEVHRQTEQGVSYRVDLNKGAWIEYVMMPGIGEKTARAIVQWRTEHGRFESIDQLDRVSGIGPVTIEKVRPYLFVTPP